jgi:hypothetical protein
MPKGYFVGQVSSSVFNFMGVTAKFNTFSTEIVLTIGGAALPASAVIAVTLSGLSFGIAQAATPSGFKMSSNGNTALSNGIDAHAIGFGPVPSSRSDFSLFHAQNVLHLSFQTKHMCPFESVSRSCLLKNASFTIGMFLISTYP